jgi:pimeloyl-ACP methyl ester carboxylesterase
MTIVLLHGVPEDMHIWDELRQDLAGLDVVALNLPGFGTPLPAGFQPTMSGYEDWVAAQLKGIGRRVCLVGHDWGGILTSRLATTKPELLSGFITDVLSFFNPDFGWHPLAKIWASPGAGEAFMEEQGKRTLEERAGQYASMGVSAAYAARLSVTDVVKNSCILQLYRSSTEIYADWGKGAVAPKVRGLHVMGDKDPFAAPGLSKPIREQFGMTLEVLPDTGHFWPSQAPKAGAEIIKKFYGSLG